jgi:DNA repair protein RecO (recombination protein O)
MLRTSTVDGFVLLTDRFGEIHKRITLFTEEAGLVSAIAHGALKQTGKLKSLTELFLYGRFSLYTDPVKDSQKITDAECLKPFTSFRQSLKKFYAASLCAEIVLKSFGGGEAGRGLFHLFRETYFLLDACREEEIDYLVLQFGLRFLDLGGFELSSESCDHCRKIVGESQNAYYSRQTRTFVCPECRREGGVEFSAGARAYYRQSRARPLAEAAALRLSERARLSFRLLLFLVLQESLERELTSLTAGKGIL